MRLLLSLSVLVGGLASFTCALPAVAARADGSFSLVANAAAFTFEYSTTKPNSKNWIGIYHASGGGPDNQKQVQPSLRWKYTPGSKGTIQIDAPIGARGKFKAYFLANDGYQWIASPIEITAKGDGPGAGDPSELKIVTFNLWHGGTKVNNYHAKQVQFITEQGVDIVGLQEATGDHAKRLGDALGWNYHQDNGQNSVGIISRHPIAQKHANIGKASGVTINLNGDSSKALNFWSAHLTAYPYGPYEFCFEKKSAADVTKAEASSGRTPQITEIIEKTKAQRDSGKPFILVGDFNAPSHLDYTSATANAHCGTGSFAWPTSKIPTDAGLVDSFRVANPNPVQTPGNTWSPLFKQNTDENAAEPQDRIDFIYGSKNLQVLRSETKVKGTPQLAPNYANNEWTSDHSVVITTYKMI
ncbi:Endonuclease/exonuclease/phosphatase [Dendryphion nanum]|uniref:Endonuclease/exonuclease/phosphatase n=1 Tax=Dendryphion nanum TaxID=256645 RepID=A0A9P9IPE1_9PLEO|nr:Endonuclease/exonuclease/phosphatase [Dendryphion nanum]